jgi:hypothetical protein
MNAPRHHIPDVVKERIRQIGCVKIYEHSSANKPSFIQWMDDKSSLKWTSPGSRKHHTKALSQQIKSQLPHDFQQNDDSYADDGIWRSEVLLAAILAQLNVLLLVLGRGYVSPDAWKAWSSRILNPQALNPRVLSSLSSPKELLSRPKRDIIGGMSPSTRFPRSPHLLLAGLVVLGRTNRGRVI